MRTRFWDGNLIDLTGEYDRSPIVPADNTLTLLKKATGIG
jgi:hypothetical protein